MAEVVKQLQKDIQAARSAQHDIMTKALASEEELQVAEDSSLGKRLHVQALVMECRSLKAKSTALDTMVKARAHKAASMQGRPDALQMNSTVDSLQNELATRMVWESDMKDACHRLRVEEWHLQNFADCLDHNTQMLLHFHTSVDKTCCIETSRWGDDTLCKLKQALRQCDKLNLHKANRSENHADMKARIAEAALDEVRAELIQEKSHQEDLERRLGLQKDARKNAEGEVSSLRRHVSDARGNNLKQTARLRSSQNSLAPSQKRMEDDRSAIDILEKKRNEDEIELPSIHKQTCYLAMKTVAIEEAIFSTHLEDLRGMTQWRRLAVVSPIFGAWLVTMWWLVSGAFVH